MELIAVLLTLAIMATVTIIATSYEEQSFQTAARSEIVDDAAQEQVTFAHAVTNSLEMSALSEGATITVASLEANGNLPAGFPPTNPLGQTPVAYVGARNTALVTYTALPSGTILEGIGVNSASSLAMSSLAAQLVLQASKYQEAYAATLVAVEITNNQAQSPYGGQTVPLDSFFTGYTNVAMPLFAELVNLDAVYSGSGET